jgi:hypothetical protein
MKKQTGPVREQPARINRGQEPGQVRDSAGVEVKDAGTEPAGEKAEEVEATVEGAAAEDAATDRKNDSWSPACEEAGAD